MGLQLVAQLPETLPDKSRNTAAISTRSYECTARRKKTLPTLSSDDINSAQVTINVRANMGNALVDEAAIIANPLEAKPNITILRTPTLRTMRAQIGTDIVIASAIELTNPANLVE
jgi:hypothetical protein